MAASLKGKVAIVTGSSAGLGEAIARLLATRGANVTFCGRDNNRLQAAVKKAVDISGGNQDGFLAVTGDVTDSKVREEIVEQTVKKFGRLDILVANAGILAAETSFMTINEQSYDSVFNTNLKSIFFLIQKAVPYLEKTKGNIVNISSNASNMVAIFGLTYSLSKLALDHLTRSLAVDLGFKGIRVNSVNPGFFPTLILRHLGDVDKMNSLIGVFNEVQTPLKGRIGVSEDVSELVAFLVSDTAGFITGELIKVDGGRNHTGLPMDHLLNYQKP